MNGLNAGRSNDVRQEQVPEAGRMTLREPDVLVQLKDLDLRPVHVRRLHELFLKFELRGGGRDDHARAATRGDQTRK